MLCLCHEVGLPNKILKCIVLSVHALQEHWVEELLVFKFSYFVFLVDVNTDILSVLSSS
jgi:hypothetical protein